MIVAGLRPVTYHSSCHPWELLLYSNSVALQSVDYWAETKWTTWSACLCQSEDTYSTTASPSVHVADH